MGDSSGNSRWSIGGATSSSLARVPSNSGYPILPNGHPDGSIPISSAYDPLLGGRSKHVGTRQKAPLSYTFLGPRRHLTWKRTPMHDKALDLEMTEAAGKSAEGGGDADFDDEEAGTLPKDEAPLTPAPCPTSPIQTLRNFTSRVFRKRADSTPRRRYSEAPPRIQPPGRKKGKKIWNLVHVMAGGQSFHCPEWIFHGHPKTLMGDKDRRQLFFHPKHGCYMFPEVLPDVFNAVLEYYQTGLIVRPERLTLNYFLEHIEVFDLEAEAIQELLKREGLHRYESKVILAEEKPTLRNSMWDILDHPWSGPIARLYSMVSLLFTVVSVVLYIVETLPELVHLSLVHKTSIHEAFASPLVVANTVCFAFFSVEFLLRLTFCPSRRLFIRTWTNWTDLLSILPYIIVMALLAAHSWAAMPASVFNTLRGLRLILITRILGTSRFYRHQWIVILVQTMWNNVRTLFVLFFLLVIGMVGFGGLMYALEGIGQEEANIQSIPMGMWWAVITMTTVGYGDVVPRRALGQITAIACGCCGIILTGFVLESMTYEYHRLMKSNSQYLRYCADLDRRRHQPRPQLSRIVSMRRISSRTSLSSMGKIDHCEIQININGAHFYLPLSDVNKYPNTLLGHPAKRAQYYNPTTGSYFFPRNQDIFPAIYQYYKAPYLTRAVLRRPPFISMKRFVEEIEFFQLRPQAVIDLFESEGIRLVDEKQPSNRYLRYWHLVLEHPHYNRLSHWIMIITMAVTVTFIAVIVLESVPDIWQPDCLTSLVPDIVRNGSVENITRRIRVSASLDEYVALKCPAEIGFFAVETVCTAWFLAEFLARFIVSPSKLRFFRHVTNWLDMLAIYPYIFTVLEVSSIASPSFYLSRTFGFFKTMRLLRLVSILKFSRYLKRIQMIFAILRSTWSELLMLCYLMLINSIIFGTIIYASEFVDVTGQFSSIPRGMYWAWITMLTIGYGDIAPKTGFGKFIGGACAVLGIVFWTLPMTLISDHFANYRRLFEGQEYMMTCLTRMTRLREQEMQRRNQGGSLLNPHKKPSPSEPDLQRVDETQEDDVGLEMATARFSQEDGQASPRPLLSRSSLHRRTPSKSSMHKSSSRLNSPDPESSSSNAGGFRFTRLEIEGMDGMKQAKSHSSLEPSGHDVSSTIVEESGAISPV